MAYMYCECTMGVPAVHQNGLVPVVLTNLLKFPTRVKDVALPVNDRRDVRQVSTGWLPK